MASRRPGRQPRYLNKLWPIEEIPSTCTNLLCTSHLPLGFSATILVTPNIFTGATGWENSSGGAASSWNDNASGLATNNNNSDETGKDNFNDSYGDDARGVGGASSSSCRRCGQG